VRIKVDDEKRAKSKKFTLDNKKKVKKNLNLSKKEKKVKKKNKVFKLSRAVEKNSVLQEEDIKVLYSDITSQISFFNNENELIGRKLNKNLKMDQILHPRHLREKFDVNNGDQVSIVSNTKNVTVVVLGEALNSGNLDDLIRVKNIRSGRVIKGYIKKNKIIRVFR
jgi:flagella basal body P-ring formation protein FlgA